MYRWSVVGLVALSALFSSSLSETLVVHEKRTHATAHNERPDRSRIEPEALLPIRIALKQNQHALLNAENWLMEVSDPTSPNFGQHWTQHDVLEAFKPADRSIEAVTKWLENHGVTDITLSDNGQWLAFDLPAGEAEAMFEARYFEYPAKGRHGDVLGFKAVTEAYSLPGHLHPHVDFVKPGVQPVDVTGRTKRSRNHIDLSVTSNLEKRFSCPKSGGLKINGHKTRIYDHAKPLPPNPPCYDLVTPACIRALYNIPLADPNVPVSPNNSHGVFSYYDLYYQGSLDLFNQKYTNIPAGYAPIFNAIGNKQHPPTEPHGRFWKDVAGEGNADIEASMPIIYPQNVTAFHATGEIFNGLLDAIDGSHCFPDERRGKKECGVFKPTNTLSISYSETERQLSPFWLNRQCLEYLKLGLQGVSIFIASGDYGVAGTCTSKFGPGFPATCPWVTTVGATEIRRNGTIHEPEIAASQYLNNKKGEPQPSYSSGGGFSNFFPRPNYQNKAVEHYFQTANLSIPYYFGNADTNSTTNQTVGPGKYNRAGRGFPDISANGKKVALCGWNLCMQLNCSHAAGTSLSAPIVGAVFNRINEERIRIGKGPVGFVNPSLYRFEGEGVLNDVTSGGNGACTPKSGFLSAPGWDPVTGLGTPNYPKLLDTFLRLP